MSLGGLQPPQGLMMQHPAGGSVNLGGSIDRLSGSVSAMPHAPAPLTLGMPDPATIQKQKLQYMNMLNMQVKSAGASLDAQLKYNRDFMYQQAKQQKAQFAIAEPVLYLSGEFSTRKLSFLFGVLHSSSEFSERSGKSGCFSTLKMNSRKFLGSCNEKT